MNSTQSTTKKLKDWQYYWHDQVQTYGQFFIQLVRLGTRQCQYDYLPVHTPLQNFETQDFMYKTKTKYVRLI